MSSPVGAMGVSLVKNISQGINGVDVSAVRGGTSLLGNPIGLEGECAEWIVHLRFLTASKRYSWSMTYVSKESNRRPGKRAKGIRPRAFPREFI